MGHVGQCRTVIGTSVTAPDSHRDVGWCRTVIASVGHCWTALPSKAWILWALWRTIILVMWLCHTMGNSGDCWCMSNLYLNKKKTTLTYLCRTSWRRRRRPPISLGSSGAALYDCSTQAGVDPGHDQTRIDVSKNLGTGQVWRTPSKNTLMAADWT